MLPYLDGFQLLKQIRTHATWNKVPIIAVTASATAEEKNKCLQAWYAGRASVLAFGYGKRFCFSDWIGLVGFLCSGVLFGDRRHTRLSADRQLRNTDAGADPRGMSLSLFVQGDARDRNTFLVVHRLKYGSIGIDDCGAPRKPPLDLVRRRLVRPS